MTGDLILSCTTTISTVRAAVYRVASSSSILAMARFLFTSDQLTIQDLQNIGGPAR